MSRSNWNVVVALAGLAALFTTFGLGWSSGYVLNHPQEQRAQPYRYAADQPLEIEPSTARDSDAKTFEYRTPCKQPKGREESDLCAQWKAANAAENSALWTKWGFWIGVVGSALLLWQINLTRKAVEDTSEATDAMRKANKIARKTARTELRAYLTIADVHVDQDGETVWAIIENSGQTPAFSVTISSQCLQGGEPRETPFGMIGPNSKRKHTFALTEKITIEDDVNPVISLHFRYEVFFGEEWEFDSPFYVDRKGKKAEEPWTLYPCPGSGNERKVN